MGNGFAQRFALGILLTFMVAGFQNCSNTRFGSAQGGSTEAPKAAGNGTGGYDGKIYAYFDPKKICEDATPTAIIGQKAEGYTLYRKACADLKVPLKIAPKKAEADIVQEDVLLFEGAIFSAYNGGLAQTNGMGGRPTVTNNIAAYCRQTVVNKSRLVNSIDATMSEKYSGLDVVVYTGNGTFTAVVRVVNLNGENLTSAATQIVRRVEGDGNVAWDTNTNNPKIYIKPVDVGITNREYVHGDGISMRDAAGAPVANLSFSSADFYECFLR